MSTVEIQPAESVADYAAIVDYFWGAEPAYLRGMGVDPAKLPPRDAWIASLTADRQRPDSQRELCHVLWKIDGAVVGHSNINQIHHGADACIHLHLWRPDLRRGGLGTELFKQTAAALVERFELERLFCEPLATNPAPNRVLAKIGFRFVKAYLTAPGAFNLEALFNRYEADRATVLAFNAKTPGDVSPRGP